MFYDNFLAYTSETDDQLYAHCPFHDDSTPSFTINKETGKWYCHGCEVGGAEVQFIMHYYDVSATIAEYAYKYYQEKNVMPFPTDEEVEKMHEQLLKRQTEINHLKAFGFTDEAISLYKIGWQDLRICFPVYSRTGHCVNIRKYLPPHRRSSSVKEKKLIQLKNLGDTRFYPYEAFEEEVIYIVEGEKDCIAARSLGINAVTGTGGSNIPTKELGLFKDKIVYLMLDSDTTGEKIRREYSKFITKIAKSVTEIVLPQKDFVEYWIANHDTNVLQYIVTVEIERNTIHRETEQLSKTEDVAMINTWFNLDNMCIIGVDPKTYTVPIKLRAVCKGECKHPCAIGITSDPVEVDVDPRQILQFIDSNDSAQSNYLKQEFMCRHIMAEPVEYINAQKILFQETASFIDGLEDSSFEHRYGIFLYTQDRVQPTKHYNFEACRVTDPRNQQNYYVIRAASPVGENDISTTMEDVHYFQAIAKGCDTAHALLNKHYEIWKGALGIEERLDLFSAMMLTYLSSTEIKWRNGTLKGWLDTMVIGDTRTGKSQMAQRLVKTLQMGSYINGENGKRTGVIGGIQRFGDSWVITWGAIPMNDKGLLVIDEASGLEIEDIKELSATRSSGAVTINKIAKGEAKARTRLIWISNSRSGKNLEDFYWKGYGAFIEYIPIVEDQARYDIVISAAREDIATLKGIPNPQEPPVALWVSLIKFMWNVSKENISISPSAVSRVSALSLELEDRYGGGPLVIGVAIHEKLIRLGCAFAALRGSIENDTLFVSETDINFAKEFLEMTYDKSSFDYKTFIFEHNKAQKQREENTKYIRMLCARYPALKHILASNIFRANLVREVLGIDQLESSQIISDLITKGLLTVTGSGAYAPHKMLINIVKEMQV